MPKAAMLYACIQAYMSHPTNSLYSKLAGTRAVSCRTVANAVSDTTMNVK